MNDGRYELFPSLKSFDKLKVPYIITGGSGRTASRTNAWYGPLWTGDTMIFSINGYGDEAFFHELLHWLVASKEQRKHADFALGRHVESDARFYLASGRPMFDADQESREDYYRANCNAGWGEKTVDINVAEHQETISCLAMFLYRPLHGLERWNAKIPVLPTAACDFSGSTLSCVETVYQSGETGDWREVYRKCVKPLSTVSFETMCDYLSRMKVNDD